MNNIDGIIGIPGGLFKVLAEGFGLRPGQWSGTYKSAYGANYKTDPTKAYTAPIKGPQQTAPPKVGKFITRPTPPPKQSPRRPRP